MVGPRRSENCVDLGTTTGMAVIFVIVVVVVMVVMVMMVVMVVMVF